MQYVLVYSYVSTAQHATAQKGLYQNYIWNMKDLLDLN